MTQWLLVYLETGACYDFIENDGSSVPFPVAPTFEWVDVTLYDPQPTSGWTGTKVGSTWSFTAPEEPEIPDPVYPETIYMKDKVTGDTVAIEVHDGQVVKIQGE